MTIITFIVYLVVVGVLLYLLTWSDPSPSGISACTDSNGLFVKTTPKIAGRNPVKGSP